MTLPHGFIFLFILYLIGAILPKTLPNVQPPKRHKKGKMADCIVAELSAEGF